MFCSLYKIYIVISVIFVVSIHCQQKPQLQQPQPQQLQQQQLQQQQLQQQQLQQQQQQQQQLLQQQQPSRPPQNSQLPKQQLVVSQLPLQSQRPPNPIQPNLQTAVVPPAARPAAAAAKTLPQRGPRIQVSQALACKCFEPIDCLALLECGQHKDGVYKIFPPGTAGFQVYCDQGTDGGGWTIFQRRYEGKTDFFRGWRDYQFGFGNINGEHWLGNQRLYEMTSKGSHELRIDMQDWNGNWRYAKYRIFSVDSVNRRYRLNIDGYIGNAGDSLSLHDGQGFYTKDADTKDGCANKYKGGWWYQSCHYSNLNGQYLRGNHTTFGDGIEWFHWTGYQYSLKITVLKFRRR